MTTTEKRRAVRRGKTSVRSKATTDTKTTNAISEAIASTLENSKRVRIRQKAAYMTPRLADLLAQERHSLNSSRDCVLSEALALANVLPANYIGSVIAERDLVRVGCGDFAPGTPDGAVNIAEGLFAVQVVRHGGGGCSSLVRCLLEKVHKSMHWLLSTSLGDQLAVFVIAVWIPQKLNRRSFGSLRRALLRTDAATETRFEFVLLVSPSDLRGAIFPALFGTGKGAEKIISARSLAQKIRVLKQAIKDDIAAQGTSIPKDAFFDLGCLAKLLAEEDYSAASSSEEEQ